MLKPRPEQLVLLLLRLIVWGVCEGVFLICFAARGGGLLASERMTRLAAAAYAGTFALMTGVYGGPDVGARRRRSVVFSMGLVALFSDIGTHLFLCVVSCVLRGGRFVYAGAAALWTALAAQLVTLVPLVWLGGRLYDRVRRPPCCVMLVRPGERYETGLENIAPRYRIERVCRTDDPAAYDAIDAAEAVFLYHLTGAERAPFVEYCYQRRKDMYYSMEPTDVVTRGAKPVYIDDAAMLYAAGESMTVVSAFVKRVMDIVLSCLGLVAASPVLLLAALAIRLEDGGEVFYRQERATLGGRVFRIVKFRSMRPEVGGIHRSVTDGDDRITRVGRVLRRLRIDELPQLWNVLRGDMSIVGPRPEMLENLEKYTRALPQFRYRQRVRAGLTGMAQVYGRYNSTPEHKLILDLMYIEQYSIWLDIKLILRTLPVLLTPGRSTEGFRREDDGGA